MSRRVVVVLQPSYLPWLGYFAQMHRSDVFVLYDDVQYDKHSWRNRNRIKTAQGMQWLTVPVRTKGCSYPTIREVEIDNATDWRRKHLLTLRQSYARAAYFDETMGVLQPLYERDWTRLLDLNVAFLSALAEVLGLRREICFASELDVPGDRVQRLIDICKRLAANCFYEGAAGRDYIDDALFRAAGVDIEYQDYQHPVYPQLHGEFVPHLSVVDLLFNCGPRSLEILVQ
jgi:WbqC-like protein family